MINRVIVINCLATNNSSGRHVLKGHLNNILRGSKNVELLVVASDTTLNFLHENGVNGFKTVGIKDRYAQNLLVRELFISLVIVRLTMMGEVKLLIDFSGHVPALYFAKSIVICQNPYPFLKSLHTGFKDVLKQTLLAHKILFSCLKKNTHIVANSSYMKGVLLDASKGRMQAKDISVIYQGISLDYKNTLSKQYNRILSVSAITRHKNFEDLIEAFSIVKEADPEFILDIVGPIDDRLYFNELVNLSERLGCYDSIKFHGFVTKSALNDFYSRASTFALLSKCESFGIPSLEALHANCHVVLSDACAAREVCGEYADYVKVGDVKGVAEAILRSNRENLSTESNRLSRHFAKFDWRNCSRDLVSLINAII